MNLVNFRWWECYPILNGHPSLFGMLHFFDLYHCSNYPVVIWMFLEILIAVVVVMVVAVLALCSKVRVRYFFYVEQSFSLRLICG